MGRKAYGVENEAGEVVADDALSFTWSVPRAALAAAGVKPSGRRKRDHVLASILAAAYNAWMTGETGWTSFSLRKMFYEDPARYRETLYTLDNIRAAVQHAEAEGWIEVHWAQSGDNFRKLGQSRFRVLPRLIDAFAGVEFECRDDGKPSVILKNDDGHRMRVEETPEYLAMTARIDRISAAFARAEFTLPDECERIDPHHVRCPVDLSKPRKAKRKKAGEPGKERRTHHVVRTAKRVRLYRVFNGDWDHGGRVYWWGQCLRGDHRKRAKIDGEDVVEKDFQAFHPRMLYARECLPRPAEPYQYPRGGTDKFWPKEPSKKAWVVGINGDERDTILNVMNEFDMTWGEASDLFNDMRRKHAPISQHLGSGVGLSLMRDDSEICLEVVEECLERGFVALPVHDSFIVQKRHEAALEGIMEAAMVRYERRCAEARAAMLDASIAVVEVEPPAIKDATPVVIEPPVVVEAPAHDHRPVLVPTASLDSSPHKLFGRAGVPAGLWASVLASFLELVRSGDVSVGPHALVDEDLLDPRAPRRPQVSDLVFFTHIGYWADPDAFNPYREACRQHAKRLDRSKAKKAPAASPPPRRRRSSVASGVDRRIGFQRPGQDPSSPVAVPVAALDVVSRHVLGMFPGAMLIEVKQAA